jgi:hypothetical protein
MYKAQRASNTEQDVADLKAEVTEVRSDIKDL